MPEASVLAGRRVALLSDGLWVGETRERLEGLGAQVLVAPVIQFAAGDLAELARARAELAGGGYDWLVVTSPRAVAALVGGAAGLQVGGARVAAVGDGTARALADVGVNVDVVPTEHTARGLVAEWRADAGRVLWPHSAIARTTIRDGLARLGMRVDAVVAYRTVTRELSAESRAALAGMDAVVLSSGSVGRALREQVPEFESGAVVSFGPVTTADAEAAGFTIAAEAESKHPLAIVDAVTRALA